MDCPFQVGDEVVCVTVESLGLGAVRNFLVAGNVYTVASMAPDTHAITGAPVIFVSLKELDGGWDHRRFRKVEKPKTETSIEIFRRIDRDVFGKVPA